MLLQKLVEYAGQLSDPPPPLYVKRPIRYIVELNQNGEPLIPEPTDTADSSGRRTKRGLRRLAPEIKRTGKVLRPKLLADQADYTFGRSGATGGGDKNTQGRHEAYMALLERCANETKEPAVQSVLHFLRNDPLSRIVLPDFGSASLTFTVDDAFVIDLPRVREFWASEHSPGASDGDRMECLVCGREGPVLDRLPLKIKGIPGGDSDLISADKEAFQSYGLKASRVAPTCGSCGERSIKALNDLLDTEANTFRIAGSAFVFWTGEKSDFSFRSFMHEPDPEEVRALIESVRSGKPAAGLEEMAFYAMSLTCTKARAVVRDWIDTTVGEVKRSLKRWFQLQRIVGWDGKEQPPPLGLYQLAGATVRDLRDLPPPTPRAMMRAALSGTPLPHALLYQAVRRNKAEQRVTRQRAALIKLVLLSQSTDYQEEDMVHLDENHPNPAYHCGRLLAELEAAQKGAIPGAKATIVDRFYGTASTAPASVFSRLLRGAQPHLAKLERDRPGTYHALQRRIGDICSAIPAFPKVLTLEDQGLFSLGYYHQQAHDRAAAIEARSRREDGGPGNGGGEEE